MTELQAALRAANAAVWDANRIASRLGSPLAKALRNMARDTDLMVEDRYPAVTLRPVALEDFGMSGYLVRAAG